MGAVTKIEEDPSLIPQTIQTSRFIHYIPKEAVRLLSERDDWRSVRAIAFHGLGICLAMVLCEMYWSVWLYIPTLIWIGARQHSFAIIMHEAAHYTLFKNRRANEYVGTVLGWVVLYSLRDYRNHHLAHHRYLNTAKDPDRIVRPGNEGKPYSRLEIYWAIFRYMLGFSLVLGPITFVQSLFGSLRDKSLSSFLRVLIIGLILGLLVLNPDVLRFVLLYLVVPALTWGLTASGLRGWSEHYGLDDREDSNQIRTIIPTFFSELFISSNNIGYHHAHHLYPLVPWYRLPELHKQLMENEEFRQKTLVYKGYWAYLKVCNSSKKTTQSQV